MGHNRFRAVGARRKSEEREPTQGVMAPPHFFL